MLESSLRPLNEAIQDSDWSDSDQSDALAHLSSDGTPDIEEPEAVSRIERRSTSFEVVKETKKQFAVGRDQRTLFRTFCFQTKKFICESLDKGRDISKDSMYSTLLEDTNGSNAGNIPLNEQIESGDETQVDSQDDISIPQKGSLRLHKFYVKGRMNFQEKTFFDFDHLRWSI